MSQGDIEISIKYDHTRLCWVAIPRYNGEIVKTNGNGIGLYFDTSATGIMGFELMLDDLEDKIILNGPEKKRNG